MNFIWDLDGTLIDSYPLTLQALESVYQMFNLTFDRAAVHHYIIDKSIRALLLDLAETYQLDHATLVHRLKQETSARDHVIPLVDGAYETLTQTAALGARHFVYTHKDQSAYEVMERLKIASFFEHVITIEDGFKRKPDPEAIHYLLEQYQLNPHDTYYVGDRDLDSQAALAAGIGSLNFMAHEASRHYQIQHLRDVVEFASKNERSNSVD